MVVVPFQLRSYNYWRFKFNGTNIFRLIINALQTLVVKLIFRSFSQSLFFSRSQKLCLSLSLSSVNVDDVVDAMPVHLGGGLVGMVTTGLFTITMTEFYKTSSK